MVPNFASASNLDVCMCVCKSFLGWPMIWVNKIPWLFQGFPDQILQIFLNFYFTVLIISKILMIKNDIIQMLTFHMTIKKRLGRKLQSVLERVIKVSWLKKPWIAVWIERFYKFQLILMLTVRSINAECFRCKETDNLTIAITDSSTQRKWIANVDTRENDDIMKMLTFHSTLNKNLGRKLPLVVERVITGYKSNFLKNCFKKNIL